MSDKHQAPAADASARAGAGLNRKQLLLIVVLASVVPIVAIIGILYDLAAGDRQAASALYTESAVMARLQKVGTVEILSANRTPKSGEEVFKAQCSTCHSAGLVGAPKFADAAAWAPRIKTGYDALLNSALKGKNAMAPQGGGSFDALEIGRAVVYMANAAGARFEEPKAAAAAPAAK